MYKLGGQDELFSRSFEIFRDIWMVNVQASLPVISREIRIGNTKSCNKISVILKLEQQKVQEWYRLDRALPEMA